MNDSRGRGTALLPTVLQVSQQRLRPILMTSLTTTLGLLPMIFVKSESSQLWKPLALTVVGGMVAATFLTLFVVPQLYFYLEIFKKKILLRREAGS